METRQLNETSVDTNISDNTILTDANSIRTPFLQTSENNLQLISRARALKEFGKTTLPFSFARLLGTGSDFACAAMLSGLDHDHLAASGLITVYRNFVINTVMTSLYSTGSLVSAEIGQNREYNVGKIMKASYIYSLLLTVPATILVCLSGPLLKAFGQPEKVTDIVEEYFLGFAPGILPILTTIGTQQTAYALDKPNLVTAVNILRRGSYVFLSYGLIFGKFGMPRLGAGGMGIANTIPAFLDQAFFTIYFKLNKNLEKYKLFHHSYSESAAFLKRLAKKSSLLALRAFNEYLSVFVGMIIVGLKGTPALAAAEIAAQYDSLIRMQLMCAGQAAANLVGKLINPPNEILHHPRSARRAGNVSIATSLLLPLTVIPIFISSPIMLSKPFVNTNDPDVSTILNTSTNLLLINSISQTFNAVRIVSAGALQGCDDYGYSTGSSIVSMTVIALGIGIVLALVADLDAEGIFYGVGIGMLAGAILNFKRWLTKSSDKQIAPLQTGTTSNFFQSGTAGHRDSTINVYSPSLALSEKNNDSKPGSFTSNGLGLFSHSDSKDQDDSYVADAGFRNTKVTKDNTKC